MAQAGGWGVGGRVVDAVTRVHDREPEVICIDSDSEDERGVGPAEKRRRICSSPRRGKENLPSPPPAHHDGPPPERLAAKAAVRRLPGWMSQSAQVSRVPPAPWLAAAP